MLILIWMCVSILSIFDKSQVDEKLRFVIGDESEYCYIQWEHKKDMDERFMFDSYKECKKFLVNRKEKNVEMIRK